MNFTISRKYDEFTIQVRKDNGVVYDINATIQPSGAVYCTFYGQRRSQAGAYWSTIMSWGGFPFGRNSVHHLDDIILDAMEREVEDLRRRNTDWDSKYAPGADFTGNEFCN